VVAADSLAKRDVFRLPDPFAVVTVDGEQTMTTTAIKKTLNPCTLLFRSCRREGRAERPIRGHLTLSPTSTPPPFPSRIADPLSG